jgi:two-component sensor histidine kinase
VSTEDDKAEPVIEPAPIPQRSSINEQGLSARLRQQELLSNLGVTALRGAPLQELLDEAVRTCAEGLDAELCKVLEFLPAENRLLMRAGFGWEEGLIGVGSVGADLASPSGFALHTGKPVISNHLENEERFRTPELLLVHGVRRAINVILQGDGAPYGVLEVDSRSQGEFTEHDITFLQGAANILGMAIERERRERALNSALSYHKVLLNEINHRVKNSLQLVASLINLRAATAGDADVTDVLREASSRIGVIASAHERLTRSPDLANIELAIYLRELCEDLQEQAIDCDLEFEASEQISLPTDRAVRLALVLNELVTNACKHGRSFGGRVSVWVSIQRQDGDNVSLSVRDNGRGLPKDFQIAAARTMGMRVVAALIAQLGAQVKVVSPSAGATEFLVNCPLQARND